MNVIVVASTLDGIETRVLDADEVIVNGDIIRRGSASTILVVV